MSTEACVCGHAPEEHVWDPNYPAATDCTECDCIAYECDRDHDESGEPCPRRPPQLPDLRHRGGKPYDEGE